MAQNQSKVAQSAREWLRIAQGCALCPRVAEAVAQLRPRLAQGGEGCGPEWPKAAQDNPDLCYSWGSSWADPGHILEPAWADPGQIL